MQILSLEAEFTPPEEYNNIIFWVGPHLIYFPAVRNVGPEQEIELRSP